MKRILSFLLLILFTANPVFAVQWVQATADGKKYIDESSIRKYDSLQTFNEQNCYSIWVKELNDSTQPFKSAEAIYKKKIWYSLTQYAINTKKNQIALASFIDYDTKGNVISSHTYDYEKWSPIAPETVAEVYLNFILNSQNKY